jgi:tetratricopeptide (TPR) repeat protein
MKGSVFFMGYHRLDEALECYDKALSINPGEQQALLNRFSLLHQMDLQGMKVWDEIIKDSDKVFKFIAESRDLELTSIPGRPSPGFETWDQVESRINQICADAWVNKGMSLDRSGKPEEAMKCFDKALKINPRDPNAWGGKALALYRLGKFREAIPCYDKALDITPENAWAWYNKGVALDNLGRHEEAEECFHEATGIDPSFVKKIKSMPE